jgi:hypothetical protein
VLRAFGVGEPVRLLPGGHGTSWTAGDLVLKPGGGPVHDWLAEALGDVSPDGFRLGAPVPTRHGTWSCDGWAATRWVEGTDPGPAEPTTWLQVIEAGRAFHRAVAHLPRPHCLRARHDWWAVADRVAWGEHDLELHPELTTLGTRLRHALEPLGEPQVVHGDLTRNVLVSPALPPAIIDISPYWRPPEYAEAVVVADALCWHGASPALLGLTNVSVAAVARALLFRLVTTSKAARSPAACVDVANEARRYDRASTLIGV